jgi:cytochrome P450
LGYAIPYFLRGVFTENRGWVRFWTRFQPDPLAVRRISALRANYQSDYLVVNFMGKKSLLVMSADGIKSILDRSPAIYAEPLEKRKRMSHFQPNALTISRGEEWQDRRRFNVAVLQEELHEYAGTFLEIIREAVGAEPVRTWHAFEVLFERIALQIIFGHGMNDTSLTTELKAMMLESNRLLFSGQKSVHFDAFHKKVTAELTSPRARSLVAYCRHAPSSEVTAIGNQIPHWLFAMKDTLAINTARALALIAAHPTAAAAVREEIINTDLQSPGSVTGMQYLEGCIQEAMRLWPTTPLLMRVALVDDELEGRQVPAGTQVVIHNGFNHRNPENGESADRFCPALWSGSAVDYRFNHLSNGTQSCAGKALALFIAKALLATLLATHTYRLRKPSLDPGKPLPYAYDHYGIELEAVPLTKQ